jgi:aerobic-type carbon monoxide dehydrogenase small subunit (CoxS/CutS family)
MSDRRHIELTVNGRPASGEVEPRLLLIDFLREDLGLKGAHVGCEHGVCGTCTVLMNGETIRSCIMFAVQADGQEIATIEGMAEGGRLHPIQEAFWEQQGLQCGYCTPAMVLRTAEILKENPNPTREEAREGIASQLCRCTGYQYIVDAVLDAAERMREAAGGSVVGAAEAGASSAEAAAATRGKGPALETQAEAGSRQEES